MLNSCFVSKHFVEMNIEKIVCVLLAFVLSGVNLMAQAKDCVSVTQETQVLMKGSKSIFRCDIFYNKEKDAIVTHHYYPAEFIKISNRSGEMKMYFPGTNTVTLQQNQSFSTTNELLYYFVNNKLADLGLAKEGFKLIKTATEDGMMVTTWQAPSTLKVIYRIKIVFSDMLPVYAEYQALNGSTIKKIYYSNYKDFRTFRMPLRITEISYENKADSTIRLSVFSMSGRMIFPVIIISILKFRMMQKSVNKVLLISFFVSAGITVSAQKDMC